MNNFIVQLPLTVDVDRINTELANILANHSPWDPYNQIGLRQRPNAVNPWKDCCGSLYKNGQAQAYEHDFSEWVPMVPAYTQAVIEELAAVYAFKIGRVRFMRAMPKIGLSMHVDPEQRYHLVLETNPSAIFGECFTDREERCRGYHLPCNGHWYQVDTTREHFIYNGGWTPRIHLVVDPVS